MNRLNNTVTYSIAVFAFLYSGTVVYCPFYMSGSAVINYAVTSAVCLIYSYAAAKYFSSRSFLPPKGPAGLFSVTLSGCVCVVGAALAAEYVKTLAGFAENYARAFTVFSAAAAILFLGVYGASRGRICVNGLALLVFWLFVGWTVAGFFGFFSVKDVVTIESPFSRLTDTDIVSLLKNTAYVCLDVTLLAVVLTDGESMAVRKIVPKSFFYGAGAFVLLTGFNLFKNLLMFGEDFSASMNNPDLTAIRLVPLFDLPEASVIVNTFACAAKLSVYVCAALFTLKNSFKNRYRSKNACIAMYIAMCAVCTAFLFSLKNSEKVHSPTAPPEENLAAGAFSVISIALCAFLCYVLYSISIKRQNNTK